MKLDEMHVLVDSEITGTYQLRNELREFTTTQRLDSIMARVDELYDEFVQNKNNQNSFTPSFIVENVGSDKLSISIYKRGKSNTDDTKVGCVLLNRVLPKDSSYEILSLNLSFVFEGKTLSKSMYWSKECNIVDAKQFIKYHISHFEYNNSKRLISDLVAYATLGALLKNAYTFLLGVNSTKITIVVYKYGMEARTMNFDIP